MTKVNHVNVVRYQTCWLDPLTEEDNAKEKEKIKRRYGAKNVSPLSKIKDLPNKIEECKEEDIHEEAEEEEYDDEVWNPFDASQS